MRCATTERAPRSGKPVSRAMAGQPPVSTRTKRGPLKAVTWQGTHDVRVDTVPDPEIEHPTDAIIRVTSSGICGSDLHLYEVLGPFIDPGDILGHEPMGIVEEVGSEVTNIAPGDRVVIPFNISCGHCFMCDKGLHVPVRDHAGARVRHRRGVPGLHQALRPGAGRPGRVPARAAGAVRPDQGARGAVRRPLRLPLRRAAHRVAGGGVRQHPRRRRRAGAGPRPDRRDVAAGSPSSAGSST